MDVRAEHPFFGEEWAPDGRGWYVIRDEARFALSRALPPRWDVAATTTLPDLGRRRLAHAIRQDMWRLLRRVRGFRPAVDVARTQTGLRVKAGGAVDGRQGAGLSERVAQMLADPGHRAAWIRAARHPSVST